MGQKFAQYDSNGKIIAFYDSIDSPVPAGVTSVIAVTDTQWQTCLSQQGQWYVSNGELAQLPPPTPAQQLATAQALQTTILTRACTATCDAGFLSSALNGELFEYGTSSADRQNLNVAVMASLALSMGATAWVADTTFVANSAVKVNGVFYRCVVSGKSGDTQPTWPTAPGQIVSDGTADWELWSASLWCTSASNVYALVSHTAAQLQQVSADFCALCQQCASSLSTKIALVSAATTVAAVQAIVWS